MLFPEPTNTTTRHEPPPHNARRQLEEAEEDDDQYHPYGRSTAKRRDVIARVAAVFSFLWVLLTGFFWMASGARHDPVGWGSSVLWGSLVALPGLIVAFIIFVMLCARLVRGEPIGSWGALTTSIFTIGGGLILNLLCLNAWLDSIYPSYFAHGRRLHRGRTILAPRTQPGSGWTSEIEEVIGVGDVINDAEKDDIPSEQRAGIAMQWRENGGKEHASIAAFAQVTLDLMTLGAPAVLITAAQKAALDEIRHAQICYALARQIDGRDESPAPFPEAHTRRNLSRTSRSLALAQVAVDALADGALNEGIASRLLARLATSAAAPGLARILKDMAADEARHARDSWDVMAWCLAEGGEVVHRALAHAAKTMPEHLGSPLPTAARDGAWMKWGVQSVELEVAEYRVVRRHALRRLDKMLNNRAARARAARAAAA